MIGTIPYNKDGKPELPESEYKPTREVIDFTKKVKQDYFIGYTINNTPYKEFNDKTLFGIMADNQSKFNAFMSEGSGDPEESWRWNGTRPITRNKVISIAAHVTASIIYPKVFAQNDADEEDKDAGEVMGDLIKWNINNSKYDISFLFGVIAALVNPVSYFHVDFIERMQTIKERGSNGEITKSEVIDEVLSGIKLYTIPPDEMLIANAYEFELQKQRFLIRRRFIEYDDAEAIHGKHEHFIYVTAGIKTIYDEASDTFYDQTDEDMPTMVEEATYFNRREDTEAVFVNGIYLGDKDVDANPMKHRDNKNRPRYSYVKFGYEPIDEKRFFFYKSMVSKIAPDQSLIDTMWRMVMDGTFMAVMPPLGLSGAGERTPTSIMMPGAVSNFPEGTEVHNLRPSSDLNAGWAALQGIEDSIAEGSQADIRQGIPEKGQKTAFEVGKIERNAVIQLGIFGKMIKDAVECLGDLFIDLIIHFQTIGEVGEITGGETQMKFRTFLLPDEMDNGKKVTKKIQFSSNLVGERFTDGQIEKLGRKIMKEEGGFDASTRIFMVNPELFSKLKFKIVVGADIIAPKNEAYDKAMKLEAYAQGRDNLFIDQEAWTRDFLVEPLAKGETEKYMKKQVAGMPEVQGKPSKPPAVNKEALAGIL